MSTREDVANFIAKSIASALRTNISDMQNTSQNREKIVHEIKAQFDAMLTSSTVVRFLSAGYLRQLGWVIDDDMLDTDIIDITNARPVDVTTEEDAALGKVTIAMRARKR